MPPKRLSYKKRTAAEKARDDERFMELHLQKYSYRQIGEMLSDETGYDISHTTVWNSIQRQTTEWKQANQDIVNRALMKAESVLSLVERKAWEGYARSCEVAEREMTERKLPMPRNGRRRNEDDDDDAQMEREIKRFSALVKHLLDKETGLPPIVKQVITREGQAGDSSFLRVIAQCQLIRAKLYDSLSLQPKLSDALYKLAAAMGVDTSDAD